MIINFFYLVLKEKYIKNLINFNEATTIKFKNSDYFILDLINNKNFIDISNYLNDKYNYNILRNLSKKNNLLLLLIKLKDFITFIKKNSKFSHKKKIILDSVDSFAKDSQKKWLKNKLKDKFNVKFDSKNPDYLLYNVFGNKHLNSIYNTAFLGIC